MITSNGYLNLIIVDACVFTKNSKLRSRRIFFDRWFTRFFTFSRYINHLQNCKKKITQQRRHVFFLPQRYFRSILSRDFAGRRKMEIGSEETRGGNICREGENRRTWIYCIQTRRNRKKRGRKGWQTIDEQCRGSKGGWKGGLRGGRVCVAYNIFLLFIILHK